MGVYALEGLYVKQREILLEIPHWRVGAAGAGRRRISAPADLVYNAVRREISDDFFLLFFSSSLLSLHRP